MRWCKQCENTCVKRCLYHYYSYACTVSCVWLHCTTQPHTQHSPLPWAQHWALHIDSHALQSTVKLKSSAVLSSPSANFLCSSSRSLHTCNVLCTERKEKSIYCQEHIPLVMRACGWTMDMAVFMGVFPLTSTWASTLRVMHSFITSSI